MRITRDFENIDIPSNVTINRSDPAYPMKFTMDITPTIGFWKGGKFNFEFTIPKK